MKGLRGWLGLLPLALLLLIYLPAVPASGWVLDDHDLIEKHVAPYSIIGEWWQPTYAAAGGRASYVWRPLVTTAWRVLSIFFTIDPRVFRLFNLILVGVQVVLLQRCLRLWSLRAGVEEVSWLAPLVLLLHPSTPEVVGWSAAAFDLGAGVCLLSALFSGLSGKSLLQWIWLSAALLCKETALPALAVVPYLVGCNRKVTWRGEVKAALGVALGWTGLHAVVTGQWGDSGNGLDAAKAWLQGLGMLVGPPQAALAHLYDPSDPLWVGMVMVGIGIVSSRFLPPLAQSLLAMGGMLVPAALGAPMIGLWPFRYLHLPLLMGLVPLAGIPSRWALLVGLGLALIWGPRAASRVDEWGNEARLWKGELAMEEGNPYAQREWVRLRWQQADLSERRQLLQTWKQSILRLPQPLAFFDPIEERFELAKGAFQVGEYALTLEEVRAYLKIHPERRLAWCLLADAAERGGADPQEVIEADRACRP